MREELFDRNYHEQAWRELLRGQAADIFRKDAESKALTETLERIQEFEWGKGIQAS